MKYMKKLPKKIAIEFKKDGKYIVAKIHCGHKDKFATQGRSEKEIIEMVADAISVYYEL